MKRFHLLLTTLFIACSVTLHSCSSTSISKLEGAWQLFNINDLGDGVLDPQNPQCNDNIYVWNFQGGELTIVVHVPPNPVTGAQTLIGARAQYKTSAEFLDAVVEISGFEQSVTYPCVIPMLSNGKWTIDKIDDQVMRLATSDQDGSNGSYVIREFFRAE